MGANPVNPWLDFRRTPDVSTIINPFMVSPPAGGGDVVTSGLVAWSRFDEGSGTSVTDSSGNGNTGTTHGGPTWGASNGSHGALVFDGTDDYMSYANSFSGLGSGAKSIALWAYPTDNTHHDERCFSHTNGTDWSMRIRYSGVDTVEVYTGGAWRVVLTSVGAVNTWTHYAVVWDGAGNMTGYKNGVAGTPITDDAMTLSGTAGIAAQIGLSFGLPYTGKISDFRVYNRALSGAEAATLYANP